MKRLYPYLFFLFLCLSAQAQEFKVYQFPADKVPAIDGNTHDWDCVPADYKITEAALKEDEGKHAQPDTTTLKVSVKVGWCAETQKLYFLYEAYDNYWRFSENSLNTDIFEVVVDGDCSGGAVHRPFSSHSFQRCVASLVQISRMPCPELSHLHPGSRQ